MDLTVLLTLSTTNCLNRANRLNDEVAVILDQHLRFVTSAKLS